MPGLQDATMLQMHQAQWALPHASDCEKRPCQAHAPLPSPLPTCSAATMSDRRGTQPDRRGTLTGPAAVWCQNWPMPDTLHSNDPPLPRPTPPCEASQQALLPSHLTRGAQQQGRFPQPMDIAAGANIRGSLRGGARAPPDLLRSALASCCRRRPAAAASRPCRAASLLAAHYAAAAWPPPTHTTGPCCGRGRGCREPSARRPPWHSACSSGVYRSQAPQNPTRTPKTLGPRPSGTPRPAAGRPHEHHPRHRRPLVPPKVPRPACRHADMQPRAPLAPRRIARYRGGP